MAFFAGRAADFAAFLTGFAVDILAAFVTLLGRPSRSSLVERFFSLRSTQGKHENGTRHQSPAGEYAVAEQTTQGPRSKIAGTARIDVFSNLRRSQSNDRQESLFYATFSAKRRHTECADLTQILTGYFPMQKRLKMRSRRSSV